MNGRSNHDLRDLCAQAEDGDGLDPRREQRAHDRANESKFAKKDAQLGKLATRVVQQTLSRLSESPAQVLDVEVAAGGTQITVVVAGGEPIDIGGVTRLARAELARLLNRKKTPGLSIRSSAGTWPQDGGGGRS